MNIKEGMEQEYEEMVEIYIKYNMAIIWYSQRWAEMMDESIANGASVRDAAEDTRSLVEEGGASGSVYGFAINILSQFWTHGDDFRQWHNQKVGFQDKEAAHSALLSMDDDKNAIEQGQSVDSEPFMNFQL